MASGTTAFDNALSIDYIVGYTGSDVIDMNITTVDATTVNATNLNATNIVSALNPYQISHILPGTTLTGAGTFTPAFAGGYVLMNVAAGTNVAFVLNTSSLKTGGMYTFLNHTAPTSGTYTLTTTAGTFYSQGTAGTVAQFAGADWSFTALVIAANTYQVIANVGTVTFA